MIDRSKSQQYSRQQSFYIAKKSKRTGTCKDEDGPASGVRYDESKWEISCTFGTGRGNTKVIVRGDEIGPEKRRGKRNKRGVPNRRNHPGGGNVGEVIDTCKILR